MKKYDNYKDSGIEWIGDVPEHWEVNKFGRAMFFQEGPGLRNWQFTESGIKVICVTNIVPPNIDFSKMTKYISKEEYESTYKHFTVNKGDVMLASSGASWGKVAEYTDDEIVILNTSTIRINEGENNKVKKDFIKWIIQSPYINESINLLLTGSCQPNFGPTHLNKLTCVYPSSIEEQKLIANYLDHKTTQIDTLITKKEQFISLLQEERTAVINQAVTKGLDPKVKMKDSGIEWLGEIPEHWEVKRMKYVIKTPLKYGANESAEDEILEDPRYIRITDFGNDGKLRKNTFKSLSLDKAENFLLEEGDILFARSGATVGKTFFFKDYKGVACFAGYLIKASCDPMIMKSEFLYEFTNSSGYENWKQSIFQQSTIQNIGADKYNQLKIGVPPIAEQQKIIDFITSKINEIDTLISKSQQEIELLKEYKTALISEVVTGKVDVRDVILN